MKISNFPRITAVIFMLFVLVILTSCGPQNALPGEATSGSEADSLERIPAYLGFVDDPDGQMLAYALVGGTERSTWDGVASGDFTGYEGSWVPVESAGYATGFAYLFPSEDDFPFFYATLTPYQTLLPLNAGEPVQLYGIHGEDFQVSTKVSPDMFQETPAFVGLTAIAPLNVNPRYADTELEKGLRVQQAFSLGAYDESWEAVELAGGITLPVQLEFSQPLSPSASVAIFDPAAGIWRSLDQACQSIDSTTITCELDSLAPLVAVFDFPAEGSAGKPSNQTASQVIQGSLLASRTQKQDGVGGGDGGLGGIIDQIEDWAKSQEEDSGGIDPSDPTLKNLLDQLIKQAKDQASKNRNESGKKTLVQAIGVLMRLGEPGSSASLEAELAKLADEIGKNALKEADCGEFRKVLKAAEQVYKCGGSMDLYNQLIKKAQEMTVDCDVWDGDISVSMRTTSEHPAGLPMSGSGGSWTEIHKVKIWTNVDDHVMHGEDKVSYSFPTVSYQDDKDCRSQIQMSGISAQTTIYFEGFYDGYSFQVNSVTPEGGATIKQHWDMRAKEDDICVSVTKRDFSFSPFYSLIVHGVSSDSPPINIQEILDTGEADPSSGGRERFGGDQGITNPDPDLGIYPFLSGNVHWYFYHVQKKLPLEDDTK